MTTLIRWNPRARRVLARPRTGDWFWNDPFIRLAGFNRPPGVVSHGPRTFTLDMYENEDNIVVEVALPGFDPDQIDISVEDGQLTIKGEIKSDTEEDNGNGHNYHLRECFHGAFRRTVSLPIEVDAEAAAARLENGLLTLTLPKAEAAKPRQIPVKAS